MTAYSTLLALVATQLVSGGSFTECSSDGPCYQTCQFSDPMCDSFPAIPTQLNGRIAMYQTSHSGDKFTESVFDWKADKSSIISDESVTITLDASVSHQTIIGFGGAFTDAMNYNLAKIGASDVSDTIVESYFSLSESGIGYTMGRVPMASCDFSLYSYTYAPIADDFELESFNLTDQWDTGENGKIAFIKKAEKWVDKECQLNSHNSELCKLKLYASPWTAPPWMKENAKSKDGGYTGGHLNSNRKYWQSWALYFAKFLKAYQSNGVSFYAVTVQNEPYNEVPSWEAMKWTQTEMAEFVGLNLGPTLAETFSDPPKIWIHDDQKKELPALIESMFANDYNSGQYIDGVGIHWYMSPPPIKGCPKLICSGAFDHVSDLSDWLDSNGYSECIIVATEACSGFSAIESPPNRGVSLGDFDRGMQYAEDIIGDLNSGAAAWVDWNMVLDINGGPNHANNSCDAPIVIDHDQSLYYKQPMYYLMGHIARYIRPGSVRNDLTMSVTNGDKLWAVFVTDVDNVSNANRSVLVILNRDYRTTFDVQIEDSRFGTVSITVPPTSMQTLLWDL